MSGALEAAAEAVAANEDVTLWDASRNAFTVTATNKRQANAAVTAYLSSLLGELPEEAVEAALVRLGELHAAEDDALEAERRGDEDPDHFVIRKAVEAALASLRDSLVSVEIKDR